MTADDTRRLELTNELIEQKKDGRVKLFLTWRTLQYRRNFPGLFSDGEYIPLKVVGPRRDHVFAFLRRYAGREAMVIAPRMIVRLSDVNTFLPPKPANWLETAIEFPAQCTTAMWTNHFTGESIRRSDSVCIADILAHFP